MYTVIGHVGGQLSALVRSTAFSEAVITGRQMALWAPKLPNRRLARPATIVEIEIPPIISLELLEKVHARLARNNPKVTPPRIVNGPTLLTELAICASCGAGMTRTGTRRGERF